MCRVFVVGAFAKKGKTSKNGRRRTRTIFPISVWHEIKRDKCVGCAWAEFRLFPFQLWLFINNGKRHLPLWAKFVSVLNIFYLLFNVNHKFFATFNTIRPFVQTHNQFQIRYCDRAYAYVVWCSVMRRPTRIVKIDQEHVKSFHEYFCNVAYGLRKWCKCVAFSAKVLGVWQGEHFNLMCRR